MNREEIVSIFFYATPEAFRRHLINILTMNDFDYGDDLFPGGMSPENGEEKTLCVFLLDSSGSMSGNHKINLLNAGLNQFYDDILANESLSQRVEVAVISFASTFNYLQQPALVQDFKMPTLTASGGTDMVGGIRKALEVIEERKAYWNEHGVSYKRPWIVMITDGYANVDSIVAEVKQGSKDKHFFFLPIAVDDNSDMNVLNSIASEQAFKLKDGNRFSEFFQWLSNSIQLIANAEPGKPVELENPFGAFAAS